MSCSSIDLKAYLLGEAPEAERRRTAGHVAGCAACADELDRLQATETALRTLREEEIPRRIAFVSDDVFEPRWWQRLWRSGPQLGFVSAAMLSLAILSHGMLRPAAPAVEPARLEATVQRAVDEAERRLEARHRADLQVVAETYEVLSKRLSVYMAAYRRGAL